MKPVLRTVLSLAVALFGCGACMYGGEECGDGLMFVQTDPADVEPGLTVGTRALVQTEPDLYEPGLTASVANCEDPPIRPEF